VFRRQPAPVNAELNLARDGHGNQRVLNSINGFMVIFIYSAFSVSCSLYPDTLYFSQKYTINEWP